MRAEAMRAEEILEHWEVDGQIDPTDLGSETLKIPMLHAKYARMYFDEKIKYHLLNDEAKRLKLEKFEFYTMGPNSSTPPTWTLPPQGKILKSEADKYIEIDRDVVEVTLRVHIQLEKLKLLEQIIDSIARRSYAIRNAIDWAKFQAGG